MKGDEEHGYIVISLISNLGYVMLERESISCLLSWIFTATNLNVMLFDHDRFANCFISICVINCSVMSARS